MANDKPANYVREKMWVTRQAGTRLSRSQKAPGEFSPLTRDDNNDLGQVTLSPVDVDEPAAWGDAEQTRSPESSAFAEAVTDAAAVIVGRVLDGLVQEAKPHVKRWWTEQVLPAIRSAARSTRRPTTGAPVTAPVLEESMVAATVAVRTESDRVIMSAEEFQARLIMALMAKAFSDEQMRILLGARAGDADTFLAWRQSIEQMPSQQLEEQIRLVLDAHPNLLNELRAFAADRALLPQRADHPRAP